MIRFFARGNAGNQRWQQYLHRSSGFCLDAFDWQKLLTEPKLKWLALGTGDLRQMRQFKIADPALFPLGQVHWTTPKGERHLTPTPQVHWGKPAQLQYPLAILCKLILFRIL